jgi:hypothetical protein
MGMVVMTTDKMKSSARCDKIEAGSEVTQNKFHGHYYCGVRGGKKFVEVDRPDA